jgi:hypothetical protein
MMPVGRCQHFKQQTESELVKFEVLTVVSMKMTVFWVVARVHWYKFANVTVVHTASSITLIREAVRTFKTLVNLYQCTRATTRKAAAFGITANAVLPTL